jgi:hypothetical protein
MISKQIIQKYVFNKPTTTDFLVSMAVLVSIFIIGFLIATFSAGDDITRMIGFINMGFLIGVSLTKTKNILFPIGIMLIYNMTVIIARGLTDPSSYFETGLRSVGDALYIAFIIYWTVLATQYILSKIKKQETLQEEPITTLKFIIGSVVAGHVYGILMLIEAV